MSEVAVAAHALGNKLKEAYPMCTRVWGVPRGGIPAAMALAAEHPRYKVVDVWQQADIIIDDLIDSGVTAKDWAIETGLPVAALFSKHPSTSPIHGVALPPGEWVVFPWEGSTELSADDIPRRLLQFIGENPDREGLRETPARFIKAWREWASGYQQDPKAILKTFEDGADGSDQLVLVRDIPVYSHCEHHLAPFFGVAHVGYIPDGKIVGLSKLSRLVDIYARRLQVQERMTNQIANAIDEHLKPKGVGVIISCRHMCMESRGVQRSGATTLTSALRGCVKDEASARAEFLNLTGVLK